MRTRRDAEILGNGFTFVVHLHIYMAGSPPEEGKNYLTYYHPESYITVSL